MKKENVNKFVPNKIKKRTEQYFYQITKETSWKKAKDISDQEKEIIITKTTKCNTIFGDGMIVRHSYDNNIELKLFKRKNHQSIFLSDGEMDGAHFRLGHKELKMMFQILKKEKFI